MEVDVLPIHRKGAMMKKKRIGAAICSLAFVLSISACGKAEQEILWIGQQNAEEASEGFPQNTGEARSGFPQDTGEVWFGQPQDTGEARSGQPQDTGEAPDICVYVCGAVETPGIVFLPEGSRAADALEAAGGFASHAAVDAVNLAAKISDGEKLYFPDCEEYRAQAEKQASASAGLVNINTADAAQLCTLPGIGESRAADIIAYREAHGGFASCEDIMNVSGIKESVYNKISDKITTAP
jgi:competence protein ComEA helix-hairpin-helix repeat region